MSANFLNNTDIYNLLLIYLCIVNLTAFIHFGIDKARAVSQKRRIPERRLFSLAILGGSVGAFLGMRLFHHKTRKKAFSIGIPFIMVLHLFTLYFII